MYVAILYTYTDDVEKRMATRSAHRDFLVANPGLRIAGATEAGGGIIVVEAETAEEVETWIEGDPYRAAGLVADRTVTPWGAAIGSWVAELGLA